MSSDVVTYGMDKQIQITPEQVQLIKNTVAVGANDDELKLFMYECQRRGTHPLDRLIFFVKRRSKEGEGPDKVTFQASIDYLRMESENSGDYGGIDEAEYGTENQEGFPEWAKVRVYKIINGERIGFTGTARWKEFYPGEKLGFMWRKMPYHMIAKCAEAHARRLAWPKKLQSLYTPEEMQQAEAIDVTPVKKSETVKPAQAPQQRLVVEKKPVKDSLKEELLEHSQGDIALGQEILKTISIFGEKGKEKWITDIDKASDNWAGKALGNLRKLKNPGLPEDCTRYPNECTHSAWTDNDCICTALNQSCKFQGEG